MNMPQKAPTKAKAKAQPYKFKPTKKPAAEAPARTDAPAATKSSANNANTFGVGVWPSVGFSPAYSQPALEQAMKNANAAYQQPYDSYTKDAQAAFQDGFQAFTQSGKVCAEQFQNFMGQYMAMMQDMSEKQANAFKAMMTCKTAHEMSDYQTKYAQQSFDDMMSYATKFTEMGVKLASEAMEPINEQMAKATKKATDSFAA